MRFRGTVTAPTARRVWYGVGARSIGQADPLAGYNAVVPRRFSINSLHPFSSLFILAMSRASGLLRAPLPLPPATLPGRPAAPQKDTTQPSKKNASTRL